MGSFYRVINYLYYFIYNNKIKKKRGAMGRTHFDLTECDVGK